MRNGVKTDHLGSSLTDLVTSLMVIFILLLLVFLNNRASQQAVVVKDLLQNLKVNLKDGGGESQGPQHGGDGEQRASLQEDVKDPGTLLFIVPARVMNFASNESKLNPEGETFIRRTIPQLAAILGDPRFRPHIDTLIVEGHTDRNQPASLPTNQGEAWNLRLSQDRSMEVVKQCLSALESRPELREFFMKKLSASGRGQSEPVRPDASDDENRRVVFKIRVKSDGVQQEVAGAMNQASLGTRKQTNY